MTVFRRVVLLWLLMFWQGGFLFYGGVVVTIGSDELGSDFAQGLITRRVTDWLNLAGLIVLLAWTWDLLAERDFRLLLRWGTWLFLLGSLAWLACLHLRMETLIDTHQRQLLDDGAFRHLHRWYLRVSAAQGAGAVAFVVWTLQNWRAADRRPDPRAAGG
ncbi:MAG: hypothetical protein HYX68_06235 [Planctomycetes bacterium]|nr:hypothetical protein [Planctomycetota bacterium]